MGQGRRRRRPVRLAGASTPLIEADKGGLYRSDDGGDTWQRASDDRAIRQRAWYFSTLTVHPQDADVVYCPQVRCSGRIDGGKTFQAVKGFSPRRPPRLLGRPEEPAAHDHRQRRRAWTSRPTAARPGVARRCRSASSTTSTATTPSPTGSWAACRTWARRRARATRSAGTSRSATGTPSAAARRGSPSRTRPTPTSSTPASTAGTSRGTTTAPGRPGTSASTRTTRPATGPRTSSTASSGRPRSWSRRHDPKTVYHAANVLFRTTNGGQTWEKISGDLTRNDKNKQKWSGGPITGDNTGVEVYGTIFAIAESPVNRGVLWAGSDDGLVHVSQDGGRDVEERDAEHPGPAGLGLGLVHRAVAVRRGGGLPGRGRAPTRRPAPARLEDGRLRRDLDADHRGAAARRDAARHPRRPEEEGPPVPRAPSGRSGTRPTAAPPGTRCGSTCRPCPSRTWWSRTTTWSSARRGRSVWILDDLTPVREWTDAVEKKAGYVFDPPPVVRWRRHGNVTFHQSVGSGDNPPPGAIIRYYLKDKPKKPLTIEVYDGKDKRVVRIEGRDKKAEQGQAGRRRRRGRGGRRRQEAGDPRRQGDQRVRLGPAAPGRRTDREGKGGRRQPEERPARRPRDVHGQGHRRRQNIFRQARSPHGPAGDRAAGHRRPQAAAERITVAPRVASRRGGPPGEGRLGRSPEQTWTLSATRPTSRSSSPCGSATTSPADRHRPRLPHDPQASPPPRGTSRKSRRRPRPSSSRRRSWPPGWTALEEKLHNPKAKVTYDILAQKGGAKLYSQLFASDGLCGRAATARRPRG